MSEVNDSVPVLRFAEFKESGAWEEKALMYYYDHIRNGFVGTATPYYVKENGVSYLQGKNIKQGKIDEKDLIKISEEFHKKQKKSQLKIHDILMVQSGHVGECAEVKNKFIGSNCHALIVLTPNTKAISSYFVYYFYSQHGLNKIFMITTGNTIRHILSSDLKKLEAIIPPTLVEQQKIADCLSSLDEQINSESEQLTALENHKKGLMQQLFPNENQNIPACRFPEFKESGDWDKVKFKEISKFLSGYAFKSKFFNESDEHQKLLTPKNFTKNGYASFTKESTKYTSEKCDERYVCKEDDLLILLTDLTSTCELLGRPVYIKKTDGEVLLNQRILKVLLNNRINDKFILYFVLTDSFRKVIINTATGSTVRHSSTKIIENININLPTFPEQQKIADCLASLDDLIIAQRDKIDALKLHKKGLMQGLFPSVGTC